MKVENSGRVGDRSKEGRIPDIVWDENLIILLFANVDKPVGMILFACVYQVCRQLRTDAVDRPEVFKEALKIASTDPK